MRLYYLLAILFWGSVSAAAAQTAGGRPISELEGRDLFRAACATCHASDGRGSPQSIVGFETPLPDFSDCRFSSPEPDADWAAVIHDGGPVRAFDRKMPAFGGVLSDEQINSVIAYLRTFCVESFWPRGDLNLPRALVTEKAFPENEALLTTSIARSPGFVGNEFIYEHRIGARGQYEVIVPINFLESGPGGGWNRGLGDVEVAYKHVLWHSIAKGSIFSLGGEVALPTGKETLELGSGHTVVAPFAAFGQILPRDAFLQFQGGLEHQLTHGDSNESFWRFALGKTFTQGLSGRAWSPIIEAVGARDLEQGARSQWDIVPQVQVTLSRRQHIMVNAGLRVPANDRTGRKKEFVMYLLWDWFDGGLLSGW
jgi:mono/diheme cytochrome c family protein